MNMFLKRDIRDVKLPINLKKQKSDATYYMLLLSLRYAKHFMCIALQHKLGFLESNMHYRNKNKKKKSFTETHF